MGPRKFYPAPTAFSELVLTAYVSKWVQFQLLLFCNYFLIASIDQSNSKRLSKDKARGKTLRGAGEASRRRNGEDEVRDRKADVAVESEGERGKGETEIGNGLDF